jgi:gliding motility-associated-like protein
VNFVASATFGTSSAGAIYIWTYGDGSLPDTANTLVVNHTYTTGGVFIVDLIAIDPAGCRSSNRLEKVVQVSTTPIFAGTQANADTICLHYTALIHGEAEAVPGIYDCAPPVADTTFLPDGSGVSYETTIEVECFAFGATLTNPSQIQSICLNMEHSYLGDLQIKITCPNGQSSILKEYPGGANTFLGQPNDPGPGDLIPGIGANYCFANTAAWGTMLSMPGNTVPVVGMPPGTPGNSMISGTYTSFQSFTNLVGCPLNGDWTITVTDNLGSDNGYIFSWGINFDPALLPGSYSFLPVFTSEGWNSNPDIIATTNGGHDITVRPSTGGQKCYTYQVIDNFGCSYDTTVCIYVVDPGNPGADTAIKLCLNQGTINAFDHLGGNPTPGGTWTGTGVSSTGIFNPAAAGVGFHDITYTQSGWNCDTTGVITVQVVNDVVMDFTFDITPGCKEDAVQFTNLSEDGLYWWNFGDGTQPDDTAKNPLHIYEDQDIYAVRLKVRNVDGCIDSITKLVDVRHPLVAEFTTDVDSVCQTDGTLVQFTDASIGAVTGWNWDFNDGGTSTQANPTHTFTLAGTRSVRLIINDAIPCYDTVFHNIYVDSLPFLEVVPDKYAICKGDEVNFTASYLHPALSLNWDFGDGTHWTQDDRTKHSYEDIGTFFLTVTADYPVCASAVVTDSVVVKAFPVVNLGPDSVICLDGPSVRVNDINNAADPTVSWLWSTGATTSFIDITGPGIYTVTATRADCSTTGDIEVNKDCYTDVPNAFTPNGDGYNDYFYPRQLLSKGVASFNMMVFNRWGQKVFETSKIDGRGWDGKFNEKDQPTGVYIYQIKAVLKNGRAEEYSGNVTLVR